MGEGTPSSQKEGKGIMLHCSNTSLLIWQAFSGRIFFSYLILCILPPVKNTLLCSIQRKKRNYYLDSVFFFSKSQQISFQSFKILWSSNTITTVEFFSKYCIHWNFFGGLLHWSCKSFLDINVYFWQPRFEVWEQIVVPVSKLGRLNHQWFS